MVPDIDPQVLVQGGALVVLILVLYGGYKGGWPLVAKMVQRFLDMSSFNEELTRSTIEANQRIAESSTAALQETVLALKALTSSVEANRKATTKEHREIMTELRGLGGKLGNRDVST